MNLMKNKLSMIMGSYFKKSKFISVKSFSLKRERKSMVYFLENIFPILYNTTIFLGFKRKQKANLIPKEFYSIFMQYITTTYSAYRQFINWGFDDIYFQCNILCLSCKCTSFLIRKIFIRK